MNLLKQNKYLKKLNGKKSKEINQNQRKENKKKYSKFN